MKRFCLIAATALLLLLCCTAQAQMFSLPAGSGSVQIAVKEVNGQPTLFLPAFADREALFPAAADMGEGVWQAEGENGEALHVMQSANLRTLFLFSDDPENEGREFVEGCLDHENETTGSIAIIDTDGRVSYAGELRQIRGRGNGTWLHPKRPYQIKLEEKADLLRTGDPAEKNRTWVLLAEATDGTLLHNKLTLDLGLELGMEQTSHSEFVDLYYDGDYRGTYLLAEKVQIDEGRVEGIDYDKLIEEWNEQAGTGDLEALPVGTAQNRFGMPFTYIDGVEDSGRLNAGTYLLEMESVEGKTLSDRCWLTMPDESVLALKNPQNASEDMVRYISEKIISARLTLQNGGVNPENGRTIEDDFNIDAFARLALINELAYNLDGFTYSSTWFVLPGGADRFEPGPAWDFDLAWRYLVYSDEIEGLRSSNGWLSEFYQCQAFSDCMHRILRDELYPMLTQIVLGGGEGRYLKSLDAYQALIEPSARLNFLLWPVEKDFRLQYRDGFHEEIAFLRAFIEERSAWLYDQLVVDYADGPASAELNMLVFWGHAHNKLDFYMLPWSDVQLSSWETTRLREATETEYALWQAELIFETRDGGPMTGTAVTINDTALQGELLEDGRLRVLANFEDWSYRPVDYYGEDIGLIYDYEAYIVNHPEVLDICGDDPEAVMNYFCDEGIYLGQQGNWFFSPPLILHTNPHLKNVLGMDWQNYYWEFLAYGYEEGWLLAGEQYYWPEILSPT